MSVYNYFGSKLLSIYNVESLREETGYNLQGDVVFPELPNYSRYTYVEKWGSKSISSAQGFDIFDDKVYWVSKSGDSAIPANCYVWNLYDGSQAFSEPYITIYSGHGNNLCFSQDIVYASPAYPPSRVYVNRISSELNSFTLERTLTFNDGTADLDACIDETDNSIMWTYGHISGASTINILSKWDLTQLSNNGDGTYTPMLLNSVNVQQPSNSRYYQGCKFHDNILWVANGYSGSSTDAYIYGIDPYTGEYLHTIDLQTTLEPEGIAWYEDSQAVGGYALYVGFAGMMLRKYTFEAV